MCASLCMPLSLTLYRTLPFCLYITFISPCCALWMTWPENTMTFIYHYYLFIVFFMSSPWDVLDKVVTRTKWAPCPLSWQKSNIKDARMAAVCRGWSWSISEMVVVSLVRAVQTCCHLDNEVEERDQRMHLGMQNLLYCFYRKVTP